MAINRNMLALMLVMIFIAVKLTNCQSDFYDYIQKRESKYYCGHKLSSALELLCDKKYNGVKNKKNHEYQLDTDNYDYFYNWPLSSRSNAIMNQFGVDRFRRPSRGVHDECCLRSCTVEELKTYCAP